MEPLWDMSGPAKSQKYFIGPAGWSYEDWKGIVYPSRAGRGLQPLAYLARYFNTIEINSSFYHIPAPSQCEKWLETVEPFVAFQFTVKLWQGFTHVRESLDDRSLKQWHAALEPLRDAGRLGAVLVQFPWSFKRTTANTRYLEALAHALAPDPLAIETRHDGWNHESFLNWLRENGYAFCNIDQPPLKRCLPPTEHVTAPQAYVRLHGRNEANWFREDADVVERYKYLYTKEELGDWIERFRRLIEKAEKVFVITNNHAEGRAVANAIEIQSLLSGEKVKAPPTLVRRYSDLAEFSRTPPADAQNGLIDGEQLSLF